MTVPEEQRSPREIEIAVSPPVFREMMAELLTEWRYEIGGAASAGVLENRGHTELRFRSHRNAQISVLPLPLDLQTFWRLLEEEFHTPPRRYFRRSLILPILLDLGYEISEQAIKSLSELGARFDYSRELVKDQRVLLEAEVASRSINLEGRVIYAVPRKEVKGSIQMETGIVFDRLEQATRDLLRDFVLWGFLDNVSKKTGRDIFEEGSRFLEIPPGVRRMMDEHSDEIT